MSHYVGLTIKDMTVSCCNDITNFTLDMVVPGLMIVQTVITYHLFTLQDMTPGYIDITFLL